jgi:GNAT superfamily N-acetyltransferase
MRLRAVTADDVPELARLVRACGETQRAWAGPGIPIPSIEEEELEWALRLGRRGAWTLLAEEDGSSIVGVVAYAAGTVSREDRTPVPGLAHVNAVFVHPGHWRRGIARQLLGRAEAAMLEQGYERAQLWTLEGSPAELLYAAAGWQRDGRRQAYPPMGLHVVAYVKRLAARRSTRA